MRTPQAILLALLLPISVFAAAAGALEATADRSETKKVAALVATWFPGSHPDVIFTRIFKTYTLDGKGEPSRLRLVSVYRDKPNEKDISADYAKRYGFTISDSIPAALTLGTGTLAVDGVLISTEWADYPLSPTGQTMYPHRRMFEEVVKVFQQSGRVVPVFIDKHLADNWADAKWIYDTARKMRIPLMAGSSLPVAWRRPVADVDKHSPLKQIVGISYHTLDTYGFHGLEMLQCLVEKRKRGETGIASVQCLVSNAVWEAAGKLYDPALLDAALLRLDRKVPAGKRIQDLVTNPSLFIIDYKDGLRADLFTFNYFAGQWSAAWRYADGKTESTLFWVQEKQPFMHFAWQMAGIEQMICTGKPTWPAERTLLTSGALSALLQSQLDGGKRIRTPQLALSYDASAWTWAQPPEP